MSYLLEEYLYMKTNFTIYFDFKNGEHKFLKLFKPFFFLNQLVLQISLRSNLFRTDLKLLKRCCACFNGSLGTSLLLFFGINI